MYQKVMIIGNVGRDPEMRYTPGGDAVTSFSVAVNRKWNNSDGSKGEETTWFKVTTWRKLAEICNEYLSKGKQVFIEGRLAPDKETGGPRIWTKRDGSPGASYEVTAESVKFLGGNGAQSHTTAGSNSYSAELHTDNDDIPF